MYIAVCDDQAEELYALTALLDQWQAERHFPLRYHTFRSAARHAGRGAQRERFSAVPAGCDDARHGRHGLPRVRYAALTRRPTLVFLTSSPGFAYESYGVQALEYLLKPISAQTAVPHTGSS